jgi:hypothetical protein
MFNKISIEKREKLANRYKDKVFKFLDYVSVVNNSFSIRGTLYKQRMSIGTGIKRGLGS